ncbi:MAG: choice-of-anchor J domain-containing protein [Prevotella sp.]|jgi:hypothetical protein
MKRLAFACVMFFSFFHANAQTYLNCDFGGGIPSDFVLIDGDGNTPSNSMQKLGFAVGKPWLAMAPDADGNKAACSTSWYSPKGQSDDWLITSQMTITTDEVNIVWRSKAVDKKYADGYVVYLSENGAEKSDFNTDSPLFSVAADSSEWQFHHLALTGMKGKTIRLAFVNNSNNKSRLFIDDIMVAGPQKTFVTSAGASVTRIGGQQDLKGTVVSFAATPVNSYDVTLTIDGNTSTAHFDSTLVSGEPRYFSFDNAISMKGHENHAYQLSVNDGTASYEGNFNLISYVRKIFLEECTATGCPWCVRGFVFLDSMLAKYRGQTCGVSIHWWESDPMYNEAHVSGLSSLLGISSIPAIATDRKYSYDPMYVERVLKTRLDEDEPVVGINLSATVDNKEVSLRTTLNFETSHEALNYRLSFLVVEDSVHKAGDSDYDQSNAYSGGGSGEMGGYEDLPGEVPSDKMYYPLVSRSVEGDFNGIEGSVPTEVEGGEDYFYDYQFELPNNILNYNNVEIVALLIDANDNHVINSESVRLNSPTGIHSVNSHDGQCSQWFSLDGKRLSQPQPGLNILRKSDGRCLKVMVR